MTHRKVAEDCWRLIKALVDEDPTDVLEQLDPAAINLIEMACDSAAEAQRAQQWSPAPEQCPQCYSDLHLWMRPHDSEREYRCWNCRHTWTEKAPR